MKNENEIGKAIVGFHIGRGGRFYNPGWKSYNSNITCFNDVLSDMFINDEDPDGNPLPDDEWTVTDGGGNVLLEGRAEIEAETGVLDIDGNYDKYIVKRLEDCDENELMMIYKAGIHHELTNFELLDYCCERLGWKRISRVVEHEESATVYFTDNTEAELTFSQDENIADTVSDFFTEHCIDERSRERWEEELVTDFEDLYED